ncbi:nucleoside deaminase [Govanella unica]|uniref:Nucleoside deaminase n=1 Tax=Govanella unica TaxID=2975056 RepID=A0A9X3TV61_9PROT|nr:nucleoside deaminase [Govania unica]MDA5192344.1 nucleoside deaminase [Govania unica]
MTAEDFMSRAIALGALCEKAAGDRPFGAVVVRDGQIIGAGRNRAGSLKDPTAHAELLAIRDACARTGSGDLSGAEIYASGEPCPMCAAAIGWAGIDRVVYGAAAALAVERRSPAVSRLLSSEAAAMMAAWTRQ